MGTLGLKKKERKKNYLSMVPATWEAELGGPYCEAGPWKSTRPNMKYKLKAKGRECGSNCRALA
jgi:hypothetical protein